jgi:glycosyltransferase involved in cell wall biosynthesis
MRIAWFTPFHVDSAIGEFSQHVALELAKRVDVELWVAEEADVEFWTSDDAPLLSSDLPLVRYSLESDALESLRGYDAIIYNLGNYLGYHGTVHAVSQRYPGIVILHDRVLHHLFSEMWLMESQPDPSRYIERMGAHYGAAGAEVARESLEGKRRPVWESEEELLRYPLYEEGIVNALGVVTHSEGQARDVRAKWCGPVAALRLPCYRDVLTRAIDARDGARGEKVRLLTMGHLNPNKQVHRVIEMLAADRELASRVEYRVVGPDGGFTSYMDTLRGVISHNEHIDVKLLGRLSDADLEGELKRADIFVNLRYPNIEGSSASLLKQLAYGRPVLCFDSGFFGEVPEGSVVRVAAGDFAAASESLSRLVLEPDCRVRVGEQARELASSYSEGRYAEGLLSLVEASRRAKPGLELLGRVARELGHMQVDDRMPIFDEIANDFARILDV